MALVVGFDLDMTLLDTRAGIAATYRALTAETGVHVDVDLAVSRLGPPLRAELVHWFAPAEVEAAVLRYRALYPTYAIAPSVPLPGAVDAVEAVREAGGRVVVITSKLGRLAALHLRHVGLAVDEVHGDVFAEGKAEVLRSTGAVLYVGDHVADVRAGVLAEVPVVAVATGPCQRSALEAAGATVVLDDLRAFPASFRGAISVGRAPSGD